MSLKGPLRRLARDIEWLETEGTFRQLEIILEMIQTKQEIADNLARNKEMTAEFERSGLLRTLQLPPPSWAKKPAPRPEPTKALGLPSANRDAPLRGAPQGEAVRVVAPTPPPQSASPPEPTKPHPEEPRETRRLEGSESAPPLVQPFTCDLPPEMQIRPVTWRKREASDYDDDPDDMYGKCIVDYDPLAQEDADYYDNEDDD